MQLYKRGVFYAEWHRTSNVPSVYGPQGWLFNIPEWHDACAICDALHTAYLMGATSVQNRS